MHTHGSPPIQISEILLRKFAAAISIFQKQLADLSDSGVAKRRLFCSKECIAQNLPRIISMFQRSLSFCHKRATMVKISAGAVCYLVNS
jgi:hypothetical protein